MSREHRKNLSRGIKQPLVSKPVPFRASRHGKPQVYRSYKTEEVMVTPGTPNARRFVEQYDPSVAYPAGTVVQDDVVIVHRIHASKSTWAETRPDTERTMRVAAGPTSDYGQRNVASGRKTPAPERA